MNITIQKTKLSAYIFKGTTEDIALFLEIIDKAIQFYLTNPEYQPISQDDAKTIYFLKWLKKSICIEQPNPKDSGSNVVISVANWDFALLQAFQSALDRVIQDLFSEGAEKGLSKELSEAGFFLNFLSRALTPSLTDITKEIQKSQLN